MKQLILAVGLAFALMPAAFAADTTTTKEPSPAQKAQQDRMKQCNADAGAKKMAGDERKAFMSKCLSEQKPTQQEKMTACNKDAGDKKLAGDERKKFMSNCLKG